MLIQHVEGENCVRSAKAVVAGMFIQRLIRVRRNLYVLRSKVGWRFAAALLPRLFRKNPRSHHKGATCRVRTGDQLLPVPCHCQLGHSIPVEYT